MHDLRLISLCFHLEERNWSLIQDIPMRKNLDGSLLKKSLLFSPGIAMHLTIKHSNEKSKILTLSLLHLWVLIYQNYHKASTKSYQNSEGKRIVDHRISLFTSY